MYAFTNYMYNCHNRYYLYLLNVYISQPQRHFTIHYISYLMSKNTLAEEIHSLYNLIVPHTRTCNLIKAFFVSAQLEWNSLPIQLKMADSLACFKCHYKAFLTMTLWISYPMILYDVFYLYITASAICVRTVILNKPHWCKVAQYVASGYVGLR